MAGSFQCGMSLKLGWVLELRTSSPFVGLGVSGVNHVSIALRRRRAQAPRPKAAGVFREIRTAVVVAKRDGKVGNLPLVFHFSRPLRPRCGNVGISPAVGEISKGLVERVGSLSLAFHAFHSPAISTALPHRDLRQRVSKATLAFCIRRAASVSLLAAACCCSRAGVIPCFKDFSHSGNDVSFS